MAAARFLPSACIDSSPMRVWARTWFATSSSEVISSRIISLISSARFFAISAWDPRLLLESSMASPISSIACLTSTLVEPIFSELARIDSEVSAAALFSSSTEDMNTSFSDFKLSASFFTFSATSIEALKRASFCSATSVAISLKPFLIPPVRPPSMSSMRTNCFAVASTKESNSPDLSWNDFAWTSRRSDMNPECLSILSSAAATKVRVDRDTSSAACMAFNRSAATAPMRSLATLALVTNDTLFSSIVESTWFARMLRNSAELASFLSNSSSILLACAVSVLMRSSTKRARVPWLPSGFTTLFRKGSIMRRS